jgi:hypothetical protein
LTLEQAITASHIRFLRGTMTIRERYTRLAERRSEFSRANCRQMDQRTLRAIRDWERKGIATVADLVRAFTHLTPRQQSQAVWMFQLWRVRKAVPLLLARLDNPRTRLEAANALGSMEKLPRVDALFIDHARRELSSVTPDSLWLHAALIGLRWSSATAAADIFVTIFERQDLPGWLRGDAGDRLGCFDAIDDRRTHFYRRARDAALRGIHDDDIHVQFWSMYVIMTMAATYKPRQRAALRRDFAPALPRLREIAATDQRLSPGYWWPMFAEAEDAIYCIETGKGMEMDAAERHPSRSQCASE